MQALWGGRQPGSLYVFQNTMHKICHHGVQDMPEEVLVEYQKHGLIARMHY
jgi:hypothetical protein